MFHSEHHLKKHYSRVRVVHNIAKGPKVNVFVDGKAVLSNVPYKAASSYLKLSSGRHTLAITTTDGTKLASTTVDLIPEKDYTVIAHGDVSNLSTIALLALRDNNSCPAANKSHVRFVHAAATVPNVDIYANGQLKIFSNVTYGSLGTPGYLSILSGKIDLSVTPAGAGTVVLGPLHVNLEAGKTYTIIASGLLGDATSPITAIVSEDNSCSTFHTYF